jgi:hypothetical protein
LGSSLFPGPEEEEDEHQKAHDSSPDRHGIQDGAHR